MDILVIESSPHKHGSSNLLAEEFIRGAKEAGHAVTVFDAGHASLHPCLGCDACGMSGPCVQKDDMAGLREKLLKTDMAVCTSPVKTDNRKRQPPMVELKHCYRRFCYAKEIYIYQRF